MPHGRAAFRRPGGPLGDQNVNSGYTALHGNVSRIDIPHPNRRDTPRLPFLPFLPFLRPAAHASRPPLGSPTASTVPVDSLHSFGSRVRPAGYLGTATPGFRQSGNGMDPGPQGCGGRQRNSRPGGNTRRRHDLEDGRRREDLDGAGPLGLKLLGLGKQGGQAPGVPEAARLAGSDAAATDEIQEAGQGLAGVDIFD